MTGGILHKKYDNCNDAYSIANFLADPRYPNNPDRVDLMAMWEYLQAPLAVWPPIR